VLVLLATFGISSTFNACYLATYDLFPVSICGTCFGICNIISRTVQIGAPYLAEVHPMCIG